MAVSAFSRSLDVFAANLKRPMRDYMQGQARRIVAETQRQFPPAPAPFRVNIGGRAASIEEISGEEGVLLFFDHRREVAYKVMNAILAMSPEVSGEYKRELTLFVNGQEAPSVMAIQPGDGVSVVNTAPYARRLEVGKKKDGSPFVTQVPPGIVERAGAKLVGKDFRRVAQVYFTYQDIGQPYILKGRFKGTSYVNNLGRNTKRRMTPDRRAGEAVRYPAILIEDQNYVLR